MKQRTVVLAGILMVAASQTLAQNPVRPSGQGVEESAADGNVKSTPRLVERHPRYQLRPGDSFEIDFTLTPEFNQTVSVQPDGYGSLKAVGSIPVEGKTIPELTEVIKAAYAHILHDSVMVITLKDFDKPFFIASGQVTRPGKYDLRSEMTMSEALAVAGGMNDKAKSSEIVLFRKTREGTFEGKAYNIKKLVASRNLSEDPLLLPGDMVYVPQSTFSHIKPFLPTTSAGAYYNPLQY
jgi:polysaccharide export outer membrane protein